LIVGEINKTNLFNDPFELTSFEEIQEMDKQRSQAIDALQKQIKWIENHSHGNAIADVNLKQIKQELAELLQEEAKVDALRRLAL
jgi:hypothetical protein